MYKEATAASPLPPPAPIRCPSDLRRVADAGPLEEIPQAHPPPVVRVNGRDDVVAAGAPSHLRGVESE